MTAQRLQKMMKHDGKQKFLRNFHDCRSGVASAVVEIGSVATND